MNARQLLILCTTAGENLRACVFRSPLLGHLIHSPHLQTCNPCSKQLLGRPSLLVRATRPLKKGAACGWLSGRLTEAPADSDTVRV